ncbi:MAG TPA: glycosyltransferase family 2 protein, partial [Terriglobales bacterium]|nr:glycosyltransferase family 2 protein [Terriglobales bacterium]
MDLLLKQPVRPVVSIIVPARNEEACVGLCVESLTTQAGIPFEIIVVDDGSTDRTREIAESFSGVCVIDAGLLPPNWTGKNHAMAAGAAVAKGEWLLFTDADTVHNPESLARAVAEAERNGAALLSYSPEQEVQGFWEKALMPVVFAELAAAFRPSEVSDPAWPAAAANGQYLLISREAYDAVGGHATVAVSLLEDVDLARVVKASGRKIFFRYGGEAVRTRMYRNFGQLREGWTKNLALLFPASLKLAALRFGEFVVIAGCAISAGILAFRGALFPAIFVGGVALTLCSRFLMRIRRAHFSWNANALAIFGLPLFSYLLLRSRIRHRRGNVNWKGRTYHPSSNARMSR